MCECNCVGTDQCVWVGWYLCFDGEREGEGMSVQDVRGGGCLLCMPF